MKIIKRNKNDLLPTVLFDVPEYINAGPVKVHMPVGLQVGIFFSVVFVALFTFEIAVGAVDVGPEEMDLTSIPQPTVVF